MPAIGGKAGGRDRRRHGRGVRGELFAARRPQRLPRRGRRAGPWRVLRQCRRVQRLLGDAGVDAGGGHGTCRAGCSTRSGPCRCAGATCRRSRPGWCASCAPARRKRCTPRRARLRPLVGADARSLAPLVREAGAEDLVHRLGHLYVYRSAQGLEKDRLAWELRRENGVEIDEFDADELRQLEPALSRDYVARHPGARERPHLQPAGPGAAPARRISCARAASSMRARGTRLPPRRRPARRDPHRSRRFRRPMPRSSAPAPGRSRSPPRSATGSRSKPSAAII